MVLEFADIADPPNVVAGAVVLDVCPVQFAAADLLAQVNCLQHGAIGMAAAAQVVNFARARRAEKLPDGLDEIVAVDVVAYLLPLVAEDAIGLAGDGAFHQVGQKSMQLGAGMAGAGEAAAAETHRAHAEITAVFLDEQIGGGLAGAEKRMLGLVNGHGFINAVPPRMGGFDLPAFFQRDERQAVGRVAIDLVCAGKDEGGLRAMRARGFKQVQGADGIHAKVRVRFARGPVMGRLGGGVDDGLDVRAEFFENALDGPGVADVRVEMAVFFQAVLEAFAGGVGGGFRAEEAGAHVVVNSGNLKTLRVKAPAGFRSDQPRGPGYNDHGHPPLTTSRSARIQSQNREMLPGSRTFG